MGTYQIPLTDASAKGRKAGKSMNKNLLIVGASTYGVLASEIAEDMKCFEKISFVNDEKKHHMGFQ